MISIDRAENIQKQYKISLDALEKYRPRTTDYIEKRKKLLENARNFYDGREMIVNSFKNKIFLKACVSYFYQIFIFSPNDSLSKTMKNAFYSI